MAKAGKSLSEAQLEELLNILQNRFDQNMHRHEKLKWEKVADRLKADTVKLWKLQEMERTGGEPDVVGFDENRGEFIFYDCAAESPKGRRSLCYDPEALESRKKFKPENSALGMASDIGVDLMTEEEYRNLQKLGEFDTKTSSWLSTPSEVREKGGAIFGDRRYGRVFVYHNGAESYYKSRGFRAVLRV